VAFGFFTETGAEAFVAGAVGTEVAPTLIGTFVALGDVTVCVAAIAGAAAAATPETAAAINDFFRKFRRLSTDSDIMIWVTEDILES